MRAHHLIPCLCAVIIAGCQTHQTIDAAKTPTAPRATTSPKPPPTPNPEPIADSDLTLDQALHGQSAPPEIRDRQTLVDVEYHSFDGNIHKGQILVDQDLAEDVKQIFGEIKATHFPISKVVPISEYGWSDDVSVAADNTSGFNYRRVPATHELSHHALGRAIDLNPWENPYMDPVKGTTQTYDPKTPGTLTADSPPVKIFRAHGWAWGGQWRRGRDYQHFEKL